MPTTSEKIVQARQRRSKLIADARAIRDRADKESKRDLNSEETEQITRILGGQDKEGKSVKGEIDTVDDELRSLEVQQKQEQRLEQLERENGQHEPRRTDPNGTGDGDDAERRRHNANEHRYQLRHSGRERVLPIAASATNSDEYRAAYEKFLKSGSTAGLEQRVLQADNLPEGGFLVAPQQMAAGLIKGVDDLVLIRQWATVHSVGSSDSLGHPTLDTDVSDAEWTGELGSPTNDTAPRFGKRELKPHQLMKEIRVSQKLIRKVASVEALVNQRLSYKFGVSQEKAFMTGDGANKPLGLFTASSDGISTGRDVNSGANTTFTFDGVIKAKWSIKSAYWGRPGFRYLFHRDCMREIALLKDGENRYLLRSDASKPNQYTIDGTAVELSEFAPNTFTQNLYGGLVGDFSFYHIADSMSLLIQRIVDSEAARKNSVHMIAVADADGMPVLEEAFARIKFSA